MLALARLFLSVFLIMTHPRARADASKVHYDREIACPYKAMLSGLPAEGGRLDVGAIIVHTFQRGARAEWRLIWLLKSLNQLFPRLQRAERVVFQHKFKVKSR